MRWANPTAKMDCISGVELQSKSRMVSLYKFLWEFMFELMREWRVPVITTIFKTRGKFWFSWIPYSQFIAVGNTDNFWIKEKALSSLNQMMSWYLTYSRQFSLQNCIELCETQCDKFSLCRYISILFSDLSQEPKKQARHLQTHSKEHHVPSNRDCDPRPLDPQEGWTLACRIMVDDVDSE